MSGGDSDAARRQKIINESMAEAERSHRAANDRQVGGNHYKKFGDLQPWNVIESYMATTMLLPFEGYLLGTAIAYLLRSPWKGHLREDIKKAHHTLERLIEQLGDDCNGK